MNQCKSLKASRYALSLACSLAVIATLPMGARADNLLENGGFEGTQIAPWVAESPLAPSALDASTRHSGQNALKLTAGPQHQSVKTLKITHDMYTEYTLSVWIKTDGISKPDGVGVKVLQRNERTGWNSWFPSSGKAQSVDSKAVKTGGTQDWTEYRITFAPNAAADAIEIYLTLDAEMTGTAWFDDVELTSVSSHNAQRDFTGEFHQVRVCGDQMRWTECEGDVDHLDVALAKGSYTIWLSQLGENHSDLEVAADGKVLGTGSGAAPTGWRKIATSDLAAGTHHITLTCRSPEGLKKQAAYAGMVITTDPKASLPDYSAAYRTPMETLPVTLYPPKPTDPRMVLVFSAWLSDVNYPNFGVSGFPYAGASLMASTVHKYGIPITWLVNNKSAVEMKETLTQWHRDFGDEVASLDWRDLGPLKAALPWANNTVAAANGGRAVGEMEKAGFQGAWGWCWEQIEIDNISDRGGPWTPFYASHVNPKIPANYEGKLLAMEWSVRDLNKSLHFHSAEACRFSSDIDEPRKGHISYGRSSDYLKQLLDEYLRNTDWNEMVPFMMHEETHEMEESFAWPELEGRDKVKAAKKAVRLNAQQLDEFMKYAKSKNVTFMTLPQFTQTYRQKFPKTTPSMYMITRDIPVQGPVSYGCPGAPYKLGPYPLTFLYSGADCHLAFEDSQRSAKMVYNYTGDPKKFAKESQIPQVTELTKTREGGQEIWTITVNNPNAYDLPTGVTEWGDYSQLEVAEFSANVKECKAIGKHLMFIRGVAPAHASTTFSIKWKPGKS